MCDTLSSIHSSRGTPPKSRNALSSPMRRDEPPACIARATSRTALVFATSTFFLEHVEGGRLNSSHHLRAFLYAQLLQGRLRHQRDQAILFPAARSQGNSFRILDGTPCDRTGSPTACLDTTTNSGRMATETSSPTGRSPTS